MNHPNRIRPIVLASLGLVSLAALVAFAQPETKPTTPTPTTPAPLTHPADGDQAPKTDPADDDRVYGSDKFKKEIEEHPRLGRALGSLHDAKSYLKHAKGDFGGHRADAVKACDEAMKQIAEALKFDEKYESHKKKDGENDQGKGHGKK